MSLVDSWQREYQSYLVRFWCDRIRHTNHASAQCTVTGQLYHFPTAAALFAFLSAQLGIGEQGCDDRPEPP